MHIILQKIDTAVLPSDKMLVMWDNIETIREALSEPQTYVEKKCEGRNACGGCYPALCFEKEGERLAQPVIPDAALMNVITEWEFDNGYDFVDSEVSDLVNRIKHAIIGQSK